MKTYRILFLCFAAVASLAASCTKEEIPFELAQTELSFDAEGGKQVISISANGEWVASSGEPWISISPANGRGSGKCEVRIDTTLVTSERSGRVNIRKIDDDELISLDVRQKGFDYSIVVDKAEVSIPEYDSYENRYFKVKVKSNIDFNVVVPDNVSWISSDRNNKAPELDRGVRPREVTLRFNWIVSSLPEERTAEIRFEPKDGSAVLARHDVLKVIQGAAEEITQTRKGDSLAVLGIGRALGLWTEFNSSEPMDRWAGIGLWTADDIERIREIVHDDREHLLEDRKKFDDDDPMKSMSEDEYLEAKALSYVGRVRSASFSMFTCRESLPQEVRYLRAAESLTIGSNANSFLRSLTTGEYLNELTQLRRLAVRAYGLTELDRNLTSLKNLEYIDLSSNNFQRWPLVLTQANFPKLHAIVYNANQRRVAYDLSNTSSTDLGGFMDDTRPGMDNTSFWGRLLTWDNLDTLVLGVNYLQGYIPGDDAVRSMGIPDYTEADRGDSLTTEFMSLKLPRVLPKIKTFSIIYNRLNGKLPMWMLYHPNFDLWMPETFIFNQEGTNKNGHRAEFSNLPLSLKDYSTVPDNSGSYYDIHPYKLKEDETK